MTPIQALAAYAVALLLSVLLANRGTPRPQMVLMLPLIALDCFGNRLVGGSFGNTLSATAWTVRAPPHFFRWAYRVIDVLFFFQPNHCEVQEQREQEYGSVWRAWLAGWKAG